MSKVKENRRPSIQKKPRRAAPTAQHPQIITEFAELLGKQPVSEKEKDTYSTLSFSPSYFCNNRIPVEFVELCFFLLDNLYRRYHKLISNILQEIAILLQNYCVPTKTIGIVKQKSIFEIYNSSMQVSHAELLH